MLVTCLSAVPLFKPHGDALERWLHLPLTDDTCVRPYPTRHGGRLGVCVEDAHRLVLV